jgi:hypothetical protein
VQSLQAEIRNDPFKGADNPISLVNMCTSHIANAIKAIPDDILLMNEKELQKQVNPTDVDRKLRAAFCLEYERAIRTNTKVECSNIFRGIVTSPYFYKYIIGNSYKLSYMIRPFPEYEAQLEDMLQLGLDELNKILMQPMVDEEGKFDHKIARLKIDITENLQDRRRGAIAKRLEVQSKSMNLNITRDASQLPASIDEIDQKLKALEANEVKQIIYEEAKEETQEPLS